MSPRRIMILALIILALAGVYFLAYAQCLPEDLSCFNIE